MSSNVFHTGDMIKHTPYGYQHLGRLDSQLKLNGVRIDPNEIISVLKIHSRHRRSFLFIDERTRLICMIEIGPFSLDELDIIRHDFEKICLSNLSPYKIPYIYLIDILPSTINGKIDIVQTKQYYISEKEKCSENLIPITFTCEQKIIYDIWSKYIGSKISLDEDLFERRLDSLSLWTIFYQIQSYGNENIDFDTFYSNHTIRNQASFVTTSTSTSYNRQTKNKILQNKRSLNMSFVQERMIQHSSLLVHKDAYHICLPFCLPLEFSNSKTEFQDRILEILEKELITSFSFKEGYTSRILPTQIENVVQEDEHIEQYIKEWSFGSFIENYSMIKMIWIHTSTKIYLVLLFHHTLIDARGIQCFIQKLMTPTYISFSYLDFVKEETLPSEEELKWWTDYLSTIENTESNVSSISGRGKGYCLSLSISIQKSIKRMDQTT